MQGRYHVRLLTAGAVFFLAACGGSEDPAQNPARANSAETFGRAAPAADLGATEVPSESFNSANAVVQTAQTERPESRSGGQSFTEAALPQAVLRAKAGSTFDLGPVSTEETKSLASAKHSPKNQPVRKVQKALQVGFARPVQTSEYAKSGRTLLNWKPLSDGRQQAVVRVSSVGAKELRLGLLIQTLPNNAVLRVYSDVGGTSQQTTGEHINKAIASNLASDPDSNAARTYWMPPTEGVATVLEIELPVGQAPSSVALSVPHVVHGDVTAAQASLDAAQTKTACANLNPDATCTNPPAMDAVAAMNFVAIGSDGLPANFICTGTLLSNKGPAQGNYFLTANHCISTQTVASSLSTAWFFRSDTCNSATLNPKRKFLSGGADFLFGQSIDSTSFSNPTGTDTTLLRLRNQPPVGALYAGWSAQTRPTGNATPYVALHHPLGNILRRSTGNLLGTLITFPNDGFYYGDAGSPLYEVKWSAGIHEGGSSGSALFADADSTNPQVIGQLWGGIASCTNPESSGYYGRFDLAYQNGMIDYLNPGYRMVFRFFNPSRGAHFYSASVSERNQVRETLASLQYEAPAFMVAPAVGAGLSPVYRFFNRSTGVHFYTISESERIQVQNNLAAFNFEGIAWYAVDATNELPGTIPVYRFYRQSNGTHLYTTDVSERDNIINTQRSTYSFEGTAYRAWPVN